MTTTTDNSPIEATLPATPSSLPSQENKPVASSPARDSAMHNIVVGGLWCVGGILVTAITYNAVKDTGGTYIVAWGAILFGGLQFFKGLAQLGE